MGILDSFKNFARSSPPRASLPPSTNNGGFDVGTIAIGDYVVVCGRGLARLEAHLTSEPGVQSGLVARFALFTRSGGDLICSGHLTVPIHEPCQIVRPLVDTHQAASLLGTLIGPAGPSDPRSWHERHDTYMGAIMSSDPNLIAAAFLSLAAQPIPRSFGERKMLSVLADILFCEISHVLKVPLAQVEAQVPHKV